jgi:hypothetical protein
MKTTIFKIINWIDKTNKKIYLFVGQSNKNLIKKFLANSINPEDLSILKNHFKNFSLLQSIKSDDDLEIIYQNIFEDDTIYTLKNKIAQHIDNINIDNIYLWNSKQLNTYELNDILSKIFNNNSIIDLEELNKNLYNILGIEINSKNKSIDIQTTYKAIKDSKKIKINIPTELNYLDISDNYKYIPSNPYKKIKLNNTFLDSNNNYSSNYKYKLDSFNTINEKVKNNTINYTTSNQLFNAYKKKLNKDDNIIFNGAVKVYFPYILSIDDSDIDDYNETYEKLINNTDKLINEFKENENLNDINELESNVNRLHFKVLPTKINIPSDNFMINLEGYFNNFKTSDDIPLLTFKKKNNNIFKINKNSLGIKIKSDDKKISDKDMDKWTSDFKTERKNEFLEFKIFFKNFNQLNISKYFTIILFDNGRFDVIYDFKINEKATIKDVIDTFDKINNIIKEFNKKFNINLSTIDENILTSNLSYIEFIDYNIINNISFKKILLNEEQIKKSIENFYPYFDVINLKNNFIQIKFKRINNYFNMDDIKTYIESNISTPKEQLLPLISKKFSISKQQSEKEYDKISDLIKLNLENNKSKINKGAFILLKVSNKLQLQFLIKNLNNQNHVDIINKLLIYLTTNESKIKSSDVKDYKNYNNNAQNNYTEKKEIITDDDNYDFLSNSNSNSKSNISNIESELDINENNLNDINVDDIELLDDFDDDDDDKDANVNREEEKNKEDSIKIDINDINLSKLDTISEKKKYSSLVLKRLKAADPQLFVSPYTSKCQAVHKKQPIVITQSEKDYIDKNFPDSYANYVKAGSTTDNMNKYYYICPTYWCPLSSVSLSQKQYEELGKKCPKGEPAIEMKLNNNNKLKYAFLLDPSLHPNKLQMPCCKGTPPDKIQDKEKNKNYITKSTLPAKVDRFSTISNKLSNILNNKYPKDSIISDDINSYVRKGIEDNGQYALSSLINVVDNKNIKNLDDFNKVLNDNMTKIDYFELNNGNTLKIYLNTDFNIYAKESFEFFKRDFLKDEDYIKKMNLTQLSKELEKMKEFKYDDNNKFNNDILREFMIYNSFENFKLYLRSNLFKTHEEILQIFTNNYDWLNNKKYNIIILDCKNKNREVEKVDLLCSKFINYENKLDLDKDFVFIIKNENVYEPMIKIKNSNTTRNNIIYQKTFTYSEDRNLKNIINIQRKFCKINNVKYFDPIKLYNILNELNYKIKFFVINMSFKFVGFFLKNNLFIPIDSNILSTNIFRDNDIKIDKYIYIHDLVKHKCNLKLGEIKKIFKNINEKINRKLYEIDGLLQYNTENVAIKLKNIVNDLIPLNINNNTKSIYIEHFKDETIFLGIEDKNDTKSYINNYLDVTKEYENKLKDVVNNIMNKTKLLKNLQLLKHKHNPFTKNIKIDKIKAIIEECSKNIQLNDEDKKKLINDIYTKDLLYILRKNDSELKVSKDEIILDQNDINNNKLDKLMNKLMNPYKSVENSIEDYISYISLKVQQEKKETNYKFITDTFKPISVYTWKDLLPKYEINVVEDDKEQNNVLELFNGLSKILGKNIKVKKLQSIIDNRREKDFDNNKDDIDVFINEQKENIYFKKKYDKLDNFNKNEYEDYERIYDENYRLSLYELNILAEEIGISVIVLGQFENKILHKGHKILNDKKNDKMILLNMERTDKYDKFNLIVKDSKDFIFEKNNLPDKFVEFIFEKNN